MFANDAPHERIIRALSRISPMDESVIEAIRTIPIEIREIPASSYIIREGQQPLICAFLMSGFVYRQKLTIDGRRSIVSLQVSGDFIDLQNLFLEESDHDVLALTRTVLADIAISDLHRLVAQYPAINQALWRGGLVEASIFREWLLNNGRRDARERVAHLLCEISARLEAAGMTRDLTYDLPMTQEQLGDALGLTAVHINRVLKGLDRDGLIRRHKRQIAIADWEELRRLADFNERYLHLRGTDLQTRLEKPRLPSVRPVSV